jgi:tetratricopeptide (TPR) repeat protein
MLLWMVAVQCRALHKNKVGIERYGALLKLIDDGGKLPGPVLVHQTFANLLDEVGRSADALPHREMAVKLEPEAWSYDGLGDTLSDLHRYKEADAAFAKSTSMEPGDAMYWRNWVISMRERGDTDGAARISRQAEAAKQQK